MYAANLSLIIPVLQKQGSEIRLFGASNWTQTLSRGREYQKLNYLCHCSLFYLSLADVQEAIFRRWSSENIDIKQSLSVWNIIPPFSDSKCQLKVRNLQNWLKPLLESDIGLSSHTRTLHDQQNSACGGSWGRQDPLAVLDLKGLAVHRQEPLEEGAWSFWGPYSSLSANPPLNWGCS